MTSNSTSAVATRLVKEEYGGDAVLDVAAANSCAVKISRAQPHPQAAKVSQAEQRLEAVQEEQKDSAPTGRGVLEVLPPGEAKSKPRPKEVKHPDYPSIHDRRPPTAVTDHRPPTTALHASRTETHT